ncbi:unnamed protein product [Diabrotica balteata]|uniref:Uncharacterized protein n=1 Tax=Diabrotica balteata TaxID=107213 RepID=A0A9N9T5I4_DIABA|nr:unnamed protein product [Diabrotica balteata]
MENIVVTNNELLEEIRKLNSDLKNLISASEVRLTLQIEEIQRKVKYLEKENEYLKKKIEITEKYKRQNNIVIFGIVREKQELQIQSIIDQLNNMLNIAITETEINNIYTLGKQLDSPIKIEFVSFLTKLKVLKKLNKLKGKSINIAQDPTREQQEEHKI